MIFIRAARCGGSYYFTEIAVRAGNHGMRTLKSTEEGTEKVVADENG